MVIAVDAQRGVAISAATGGVRLHALGNFKRYDERERTACWRASSARQAPLVQPELSWDNDLNGGKGTLQAPFVVGNPLSTVVTVRGVIPAGIPLVAIGRVHSLIGFITPKVEELPPSHGARSFRITHDFKANDLPVDPGETLKTPLRKIVLRFATDGPLVLGESAFYVRLTPYWH